MKSLHDHHARALTRNVAVVWLLTFCLSALAFGIFSCSAMAQGNGGGKPPPPPPPPPPIHYRLAWVENIWGADADFQVVARDMNEAGVVVGKTREIGGPETAFRFFYDQQLGWVTQDLNDLGGVWTDLGGSETSQGWYAATAEGINASGQIVGTAVHPNYAGRAYMLSFPATGPEFNLLPRAGTAESNGVAINDNPLPTVVARASTGIGWIALVFAPENGYLGFQTNLGMDLTGDINNSGVIVTKSGKATPTATGYTVALHTLGSGGFYFAINQAGMICGRRDPVGSGKNKISGGPIRIDVSGSQKLLASGDSASNWAGGINDFGDVVYTLNGTGFLYTDLNVYGSLGLNQLVVNPDTYWTTYAKYLRGITNRDGTGFGKICGQAGNRSFILTPEPVAGN